MNVPIGVDHSNRELIPIRQRPENDLTTLLSRLKYSCSVPSVRWTMTGSSSGCFTRWRQQRDWNRVVSFEKQSQGPPCDIADTWWKNANRSSYFVVVMYVYFVYDLLCFICCCWSCCWLTIGVFWSFKWTDHRAIIAERQNYNSRKRYIDQYVVMPRLRLLLYAHWHNT
jgi:hypothetical protein